MPSDNPSSFNAVSGNEFKIARFQVESHGEYLFEFNQTMIKDLYPLIRTEVAQTLYNMTFDPGMYGPIELTMTDDFLEKFLEDGQKNHPKNYRIGALLDYHREQIQRQLSLGNDLS
ncbi:MAG: hypothetical protein WBK77_03695 [Alphaproteobacteria bacterium]